MISLSILIPVYNADVVAQVVSLRRQCMAIRWLAWEIVVADDGSTDGIAARNERIGRMLGCRMLWRGRNYGRSSTRNYLARMAKYDTLLYIDSGLKPSSNFVAGYAACIGRAPVVCGTVGVDKASVDPSSLRCLVELRARRRFTAERCGKRPYKNFHTTAFMASRSVMLANPMREDITTYGHEDTLFGKRLEEQGVGVMHAGIPVLFTRFEGNARYLEKTREAIATLFAYRHELEGYSSLLRLAGVLRRCRMLWAPHIVWKCCGRAIERRLEGQRPSLMLFDVYRVCLLAEKFLG